MKLAFVTLIVLILPFLSPVSAQSIFARARGKNGKGGNGGGNNQGGDAGGNNGTAGGASSDDPQTSLTLDPKVIGAGFANDGQDVPTPGQVASLTSTNNFINFCLLSPDLPITNGQQIKTGSCNPVPMGVIPASSKVPSAKFANPKNGDKIPANKAFTVKLAIINLATGNFVNAQTNYYSAPQQVDGSGVIIGHSHVTIQALTAVDQTTPPDPGSFAFFKGFNEAAVDGVLSADVTDGLPPGEYRACSITTDANHSPVVGPVAQRGAYDDCSYFSTE